MAARKRAGFSRSDDVVKEIFGKRGVVCGRVRVVAMCCFGDRKDLLGVLTEVLGNVPEFGPLQQAGRINDPLLEVLVRLARSVISVFL